MIRISFLSFFSHLVLNALRIYCDTQRQSSGSVLQKACSETFRKIHRKITVPESLFHKVAGQSEKRLQYRCFSVNFARFFRRPILYNICEWLFLVLVRIGLVCGVLQIYRCFSSLSVSQYLRYWDAVFN